MNDKFDAIIAICIVPKTIELISKHEGIDEIEALNKFYNSKTYHLLSIEDTKIWHYSPLTIYNMWKSEFETGEIIFPEG